ncbi:MAG: hypothetical protein WD136_06000 [Cyanobium sp.]
MKSITRLDDHQCEVLRGGYWGNFFSANMTSYSMIKTTVGQTNTATNTGLGLLVGLGNAQSIQGNASEVFSFVL